MELEPKMEALYGRIREMNEKQLRRVVGATIKRYAELYPDEEIVFLSMPKKNLEQREEILDGVRRFATRIDWE